MNKEVMVPAPQQETEYEWEWGGAIIDGNENTAQMVHHQGTERYALHHQGTERCALHPQDYSTEIRKVCVHSSV